MVEASSVMNLLAWACRPRVACCLAFAVLLPVNIAHVATSPWFRRPPKPVGDGLDYENIAFHLARGQGYVYDNSNEAWRAIYQAEPEIYADHLATQHRHLASTGRPPLFPTIVAGIYGSLGRNSTGFAAVRLFSAICLAIAGALAVMLAAHLLQSHFSPKQRGLGRAAVFLGLAATTVFAATHRTLKSYTLDFLTEPLALLLMQLLVVGMVWRQCGSADAREHDQAAEGHDQGSAQLDSRQWWFTGVVLGAMILARSVYVAWLPGIWGLLFLASRGTYVVRAKQASGIVLIALVCCLPWWSRNMVVLGQFRPLGTQGPITLLGGYSDEALAAGGEWQFAPEQQLRQRLLSDPSFAQAENDTARELLVAEAAGREVREWIGDHWSDLPGMFIARVIRHWNPYHGRSLLWKLLVLVGAAWLVTRGGPGALWLLGLLVLSSLVAGALYSVGGRFLVPAYGILFTLAGLGVSYAAYGGMLMGLMALRASSGPSANP